MRENIFRFKKFSVRNEDSAMKVGTDGVLLGAWCDVEGAIRILDVGTGTGLISLMLAQRQSEAIIDAIEIDDGAYREAVYNFNESVWRKRFNAINEDFNEYLRVSTKKYDLIVSNPPFFTNGVLPPDKNRMHARHCMSLTFENLIIGASKLLTEDGRISIITPFDSKETIENIADDCGLKIKKLTIVYPKVDSAPKRLLWELSTTECDIIETSLVIEHGERHNYTDEYISLTKDFYINM